MSRYAGIDVSFPISSTLVKKETVISNPLRRAYDLILVVIFLLFGIFELNVINPISTYRLAGLCTQPSRSMQKLEPREPTLLSKSLIIIL